MGQTIFCRVASLASVPVLENALNFENSIKMLITFYRQYKIWPDLASWTMAVYPVLFVICDKQLWHGKRASYDCRAKRRRWIKEKKSFSMKTGKRDENVCTSPTGWLVVGVHVIASFFITRILILMHILKYDDNYAETNIWCWQSALYCTKMVLAKA